MFRKTTLLIALSSVLSLAIFTGCTKKHSLNEPASFPTDYEVFLDEFGPNVTFEAFSGSKLDAVQIDATTANVGSRSLVVTVPQEGSTEGTFAGGAFTTGVARDLTKYNALTFYAKASMNAVLNVAGIGNANTGTSRFMAEVNNLPLTTSWNKYVIPIPLSERLQSERGLFYFADAHEDGVGYQLWFDEIQFETLGTISNPDPTIPTVTMEGELNDTLTFADGSVTFDVNGSPVTVSAMAGYFTFVSSDSTVVKVAGNGVVSAVGLGSAELTALLGTVPASGAISVTVVPRTAEPAGPAPTPTQDPGNVVSLFSDVYTNEPVDTWSADWSNVADVRDYLIGTDITKKYTGLVFAGVEFWGTSTIDASAMTHFHMDVWTPDATDAPAVFKVKLVDFGADGSPGGTNASADTEHELTFDQATMNTGEWVSIDVPLVSFANLASTSHLAQMIISGDPNTVYVDNVYFYDAGTPTEPWLPAPTPLYPSVNVISLFSDAYNDVTVDTWSAAWDAADVSDEMVGTDNVKKYTNLDTAGIEFTSSTINASGMSTLHLDVWTPSPTDLPAVFRIKLVDFGADGVSGGDDVEHELTFDRNSTPSLVTANWISFDLPLADFTNLTTTGHLAQLILSGDPGTVFVDNVYFYTEGPQSPSSPAPTPGVAEADVISLFSDAYTDVTVDTWSAPWDSADVEDFPVGSDNTKKYTIDFFAGIEFASSTIDATTMSHFHMDVWTPNATDAPAVFKVKLRDFGANGVYDFNDDDVEYELTFDESTLNTGSWASIDVPLTDFAGLTTRAHLAQLILSGDLTTVFIDNIYFYDAHLATAPTVSAPVPTVDTANVISLFSDAYTNRPVDTWSAIWDNADVADYSIGADNIKEYTNLVIAYIDFSSNTIDASAMTDFHMDVWTPDATGAPSKFKVRLVDFGADGAPGGGDDVQHELVFDETTMNTGAWVSIDVPLSAFTNLVTKEHLGQLVISGNPNTVYIDNIYLYK